MAYTVVDDPSAFFQAKLWTGNGGTQSITFDGLNDMQPDFVWIKSRSASEHPVLHDSVRGANYQLYSNQTAAESNYSGRVTAFNSNGFSIGGDNEVNQSSQTYASWSWKAGTAFTNDASSTSVGSIDSAGSINTTAGFSVITYSGSDGTETVAHGLSAVPDWIWFKRRNATKNNLAYHSALGNTSSIYMDNTSAASTNYDYFADTSPTSSVMTIKKDEDYDEVNANGGTFVAWCFSSVQGFSKISSYKGNGNADGAFVYTGFKPAMVIIRQSDASGEGWHIFDNKRSGINGDMERLLGNSSNAESDYGANIDFLSNGFKVRTTDAGANASGQIYIFMAFAEATFVTSGGVPSTAR